MFSNDHPSGKANEKQKERSFPLWLLCLLLFAVLSVFSVRMVPSVLGRFDDSVTSSPAPTEELSQASERSALDEPPSVDSDNDSQQEIQGASSSPSEEEPAPDPLSEKASIVTEPENTPASLSEPPLSAADDGFGIPAWGHLHRYHDGVCTVCGQEPELCTTFLPHEYYEETDHPGTVELHRYEIPAYSNGGYGTYNKCFNIYLPWAYDETKPYNVLVLVHGGGGDQDSWLNDVYPYKEEGIEMCGRILLDNMIEKGICEPCIVVCPVTEIPQCQGLLASTNQLRQELREYILPYVAEHYSTYAADSSLDAIRSARDHFALGGVSNGALFVYEGGMRYNYDLFGSYAAFSGNGEPWVTVTAIKQTDRFKDLTMNCYFTGAGTRNDWQQNYTEIGYDYFLEHLPFLQDGKNAWHVDVEGEHEWKVWFTDLFNALPLMFPA